LHRNTRFIIFFLYLLFLLAVIFDCWCMFDVLDHKGFDSRVIWACKLSFMSCRSALSSDRIPCSFCTISGLYLVSLSFPVLFPFARSLGLSRTIYHPAATPWCVLVVKINFPFLFLLLWHWCARFPLFC
jgi:hypothetical protein